MKRGDRFRTVDGNIIKVIRVSRNWADVHVTQPHGTTWVNRQVLVDGKFKFECEPEEET